ncbi:hypothetical protein B0H12DRAFT_1241535 [Mycena haematopus]|nr:hypothetical protein B0H12DRAFT_1241535 [Mycena haematopus]
MSDLTVLVSPIPLYPGPSSPFTSIASRRNRSPSPIMVTLESSPPQQISESTARTAGPSMDSALLSPPINTWKSRPRSRTETQRPRHRPTRSQSAPPTQTTFMIGPVDPFPPASVDDFNVPVRSTVPVRKPPIRRASTFGAGYSYSAEGMTLRGGELVRPPPPLLRPTTFWRKAHRSGVAAATYSPSAHLIRRSTYIAAGLTFDSPRHDLSALCVETRLNGADGITRGGPRVVEIPQAFELFM